MPCIAGQWITFEGEREREREKKRGPLLTKDEKTRWPLQQSGPLPHLDRNSRIADHGLDTHRCVKPPHTCCSNHRPLNFSFDLNLINSKLQFPKVKSNHIKCWNYGRKVSSRFSTTVLSKKGSIFILDETWIFLYRWIRNEKRIHLYKM